jgi:hypothetical protein
MEQEDFSLTPDQVGRLATEFGGEWCDCINHVIAHITPAKLAVYCIENKYEQVHKPTRDDGVGVRYSYKLKAVQRTETVGNDEVKKDFNVCASFGDFHLRPYDSLRTCLQAIARIAWLEQRSPQEVAKSVSKCDESKQPEIKDDTAHFRESMPQVRRFAQSANGTFPIA